MNVTIVYDSDCPVCRHDPRAATLRERAAKLNLVDVRSEEVDDVQGNDLRDLDFDEGFAVVINGQAHHGAKGANALSALTEPTGLAFWVFRWLVRTESRSRFWYPILATFRAMLLRILGITRIGRLDR